MCHLICSFTQKGEKGQLLKIERSIDNNLLARTTICRDCKYWRDEVLEKLCFVSKLPQTSLINTNTKSNLSTSQSNHFVYFAYSDNQFEVKRPSTTVSVSVHREPHFNIYCMIWI